MILPVRAAGHRLYWSAMMRLRYSLKVLLIAVTALALLLGYETWRRKFILREYQSLTAEGVTISPIQDGWWPTAPPAAVILFRSKSNKLIHHRNYYSFAEAKPRYRDWESRL